MTDSTKIPEKNGTPPVNGLESGNGTRSAAGLVVAGLVTVVGSWIGMAAYMDYRLQGMEERFTNETKQQVTSVADTTRTTLNSHISQLSNGLHSKIDDTSSILAKGLLDLNQKQEENQSATLTAIEQNGKVVTDRFSEFEKSSHSEIAALLQTQQESILNGLTQLTACVEAGNREIAQTADTIQRASRTSSEAVLAAISNLENNLTEMNSGIRAHIDSNARSLEDLVKQSNETNEKQLAELASNMSSVTTGANEGSMKLSAEMTALAQRISMMKNEIATSQSTVRELSASIPEWQKASQEQLKTLSDASASITLQMKTQVSEVQDKIKEMGQRIDKTSESMLRALYMTSEGMEGTKIEIKSQLENSKKETSAEIRNLAQTLQAVSALIENLQKNVSSQTTGSQSSALPFLKMPEFDQLMASLQSVSLKVNDLRSQIDSQVLEVKTRTEALLNESGTPEKAEALRDMLHNFTSLAELAGGRLDILLEGLQEAHSIIEGYQTKSISRETKSVESDSRNNANEIGQNPEEREQETTKVSMQ